MSGTIHVSVMCCCSTTAGPVATSSVLDARPSQQSSPSLALRRRCEYATPATKSSPSQFLFVKLFLTVVHIKLSSLHP